MYITTTSTESLPGMSPLPPLAMGTTVEHMVSHTASIYVAFQRSCTNYSCNEPSRWSTDLAKSHVFDAFECPERIPTKIGFVHK